VRAISATKHVTHRRHHYDTNIAAPGWAVCSFLTAHQHSTKLLFSRWRQQTRVKRCHRCRRNHSAAGARAKTRCPGRAGLLRSHLQQQPQQPAHDTNPALTSSNHRASPTTPLLSLIIMVTNDVSGKRVQKLSQQWSEGTSTSASVRSNQTTSIHPRLETSCDKYH